MPEALCTPFIMPWPGGDASAGLRYLEQNERPLVTTATCGHD
jgi:hypothetical protein